MAVRKTTLLIPVLTLIAATATFAQEPDLAGYFGFAPLEVVKVGKNAGPVYVADINNDGLNDLIVANNHSSRIELHLQKKDASPDDEVALTTKVNDLPEHWRFERVEITVSHRVAAIVMHDFDEDGLLDLIYAGSPSEIVFMRQTDEGEFEIARRHRVKRLTATRDGLAIVNVLGDEKPELLALVDSDIYIWQFDNTSLGQPVELTTGAGIVAMDFEDFDGNGQVDILAVTPDNRAPLRLWLSEYENGLAVLGPEIRFEMPALIEFHALHLPNSDAANIAVIERISKRIVFYDLIQEEIESTGDQDAAMLIHNFIDTGSKKRTVAVIDIDGDNLLDLVTTDTKGNALVVYKQAKGKGLQPGKSYPSYAELDYLSAGNVDDDASAELFVLSEKEGVIGWSDVQDSFVPYPQPLAVPDGYTPVAMNLVVLEGGPKIAVIAKSGRKYTIALVDTDGNSETIDLGTLSRSPETIISLDADQDGRTDLLVFTRDKPMTMLYAGDDGFELTESKDMGQYGLIKAATADNTAIFDIDGDGNDELLLADRNYVRAVRYEPNPAEGISPGWQVVKQINAVDSSAKLVSLAILEDRIVAADQENDRLLILGQNPNSQNSDGWGELRSIAVHGFDFHTIYAGAFSGDAKDNILAVGDDGFAIISLSGSRSALREFASWRTDKERRLQHELASGDINGDGFLDMISLDAGEQMCEIFTFTEAKRLLYATGFAVFESKIFSGGDSREFQPSTVTIADVTGDGANDMILLAHDRILIYPQMTK